MKILLLSPQTDRCAKLIRWIHQQNARVVGIGLYRGIHLLEEIARTTPHLLVIAMDEVDTDTQAVLQFIQESFANLSLVRLAVPSKSPQVPLIWKEQIAEALKAPLPAFDPQPYADGHRLVFHDPQFQDFSQSDKLSSGSPWPERQGARFMQILKTGQENHAAAKICLAAIEANLSGLQQEITYRFVHKSYKGLCWSRDLLGKYVGVLAHYVPGIQIPYLPAPVPSHPSLDYVAFYMPSEGQYAIDSVVQLQINPSVAELLVSVAQWAFTGQGGREFLAEQAQLMGLATLMRNVAHAHVSLVETWLNPMAINRAPDASRKIHREEGIFRDFWDVETLFESQEALTALVQAFHQQSFDAGFTYPPVPSYADFLTKSSTGRSE